MLYLQQVNNNTFETNEKLNILKSISKALKKITNKPTY